MKSITETLSKRVGIMKVENTRVVNENTNALT